MDRVSLKMVAIVMRQTVVQVVVIVLVVALFACSRRSDVAQLRPMVARCFEMSSEMPIVSSRGDRLFQVYVLPSARSDETVARLPVGSVVQIKNVIFEQTRQYSRVEVIGEMRDGERLAITRLFTTESIDQVRRALDERRHPNEPVLSGVAQWVPCRHGDGPLANK